VCLHNLLCNSRVQEYSSDDSETLAGGPYE
jgi:hypothetical protein